MASKPELIEMFCVCRLEGGCRNDDDIQTVLAEDGSSTHD